MKQVMALCAIAVLVVASCTLARSGTPETSVCALQGASSASCASALAEPPVLLQRAGVARSWSLDVVGGANVYERVAGVGKWGGWCTCPDGQRYNVGDRNDGCKAGRASLACIGGEPGDCEREENEARAGMQVTCAGAGDDATQIVGEPSWGKPSPAKPNNLYERSSDVGAWGGWCTCPDGQRYNVGDRQDGCKDGPASLACEGGTPGECERRADPAREGMKVTCGPIPRVEQRPSEVVDTWRCKAPGSWPDVVGGVTCGPCGALVKTEPYGGRCDRYCESFGHVCIAAAEEVENNCEVLEQKACQDVIADTTDMLCTCREQPGSAAPAPPAPPAPPIGACAPPVSWPGVAKGVTCGSCTALVLTAPYGGRCDRYCESFGHTCTAAAEEVFDNCEVLEQKSCQDVIAGTSDMLCTCQQPAGPAPPPGPPAPPAPAPAPPAMTDLECAAWQTWPDIKNGVLCEKCTALVLTEPYGGRCDRYCESFGHECVSAAEEVSDNCDILYSSACAQPITGTTDMLCTCRQPLSAEQPPQPVPMPTPPAPMPSEPLTCASRRYWPDIKDGIVCEACTALVLTERYGGRCDRYCASFGHTCVAAAEEVSDNCDVMYRTSCDSPIADTTDMLCTCQGDPNAVIKTTPPPPTTSEPLTCASRRNWPDVKDGIACEACTALVLSERYGGRCDRYCESFGHTCVAAAEEVSDNCDVLYRTSCDSPIADTTDMLCTCQGDPNAVIKTTPAPPSGSAVGWRSSGKTVGSGWCAAKQPAGDWSLKRSCGGDVKVRVLSYNLYWWNLFDKRGGNGRSAGKLIESGGPFDVMGFQECDSISRVLSDARLQDSHAGVKGPRALAIAYNRGRFELIDQGKDDVAEDRSEQYFGKRSVQWVRLRHRSSGKTLFFMNHHGPLPVNTGGKCGREATASRMLRIVGENSRSGDFRVLVGDFNADTGSKLQRTLERHMYRVMDDWVDAIFASCRAEKTRNLGKGGSDHDAISASFRI